jgi:hypothetical protein
VRWSRSSLLVFAAALLASLSIHLPVYEVLGVLARAFDREKTSAPQPPSTIEFEVAQNAPAETEEAKAEKQDRANDVTQPDKAHKPPPTPPEKAPPKPKPEIKKPAPPTPTPPQPAQVAPPPPDAAKPIENKLAVTQKSDDPNVPPPDNARFIAEDNRRVAEEMIASVRSLTENDEKPSASAPKAPDEQQGNATEEKPAELQNVHGEDKRIPDKREAKEKPLSPSQLGQGQQQNEAVAHAAERGGSPSQNQAQRELAAGSERVGGEEQTVVIQDGSGGWRWVETERESH